MSDWGLGFIIVAVVVVAMALGMAMGESHGVRVVECQQAGYGAPSWLSGACTVSLDGNK